MSNFLNKNIFATVTRWIKGLPKWSANIQVKLGRPLLGLLLRVVPVTGLRSDLGRIKIILRFLALSHRIAKKNGLSFLVKTQKASFVLLQQSLGGQRLHDLGPLGVRIARSKSGLPRVIPALDRLKIRRGDKRIIRFWLTLFSLYRVIDCKPVLKLNSITDPGHMTGRFENLQRWSEFSSVFLRTTMRSQKGYLKTVLGKSLFAPSEDEPYFKRALRARPFIIDKTSPTWYKEPGAMFPQVTSTSPVGLVTATAAWASHPLREDFHTWLKATGNHMLLNLMDILGTLKLGKASHIDQASQLGRLGLKVEPAGKIRVFAMCDPFTQWAFRPLWDDISQLLRLFPTDGTYDQYRPLERLNRVSPGGPRYSFDLSSATDRLPVLLQQQLLIPFLGPAMADLWRRILVGREYWLTDKESILLHQKRPYIKTKSDCKPLDGKPVTSLPFRYEVGQPMGALTSWGMLALTHHALVQFAAQEVGHPVTSLFTGYALLGDDIVIADTKVARSYLKVMREVGVEVNLSKSLESPKGTVAEFAKRTIVRGEDCSAVPIKELYSGLKGLSNALELARKYSLTPSMYLRVFGAKYKTLGSIQEPFTKMGRKWASLLLGYISPSGVQPRTWSGFIRSKSLTKNWADSERIDKAVSEFLRIKLRDHLSVDNPIWVSIKRMVTVDRTGNFYGVRRTTYEEWKEQNFDPFYLDAVSEEGFMLENAVEALERLKNVLYRQAYWDVLTTARDIRNKLEEEKDISAQEMILLLKGVMQLPLPSDLTHRHREMERALNESIDLVLWFSLSKVMRTPWVFDSEANRLLDRYTSYLDMKSTMRSLEK